MSKNEVCPKGQIYRDGYTRYRGSLRIDVPGNCITATSQSGLKRSVIDKKILEDKAKIHEQARKKFSKTTPKKCPKGKILREGYYRKPSKKSKKSTGSWVAPVCVPSINKVKGTPLFTLEKIGRASCRERVSSPV